jgi:hypothetical protein
MTCECVHPTLAPSDLGAELGGRLSHLGVVSPNLRPASPVPASARKFRLGPRRLASTAESLPRHQRQSRIAPETLPRRPQRPIQRQGVHRTRSTPSTPFPTAKALGVRGDFRPGLPSGQEDVRELQSFALVAALQRELGEGRGAGKGPHPQALDAFPPNYADISEERRLGYVAITRGMRRVTITHCEFRRGHTSPSSFIEDLPAANRVKGWLRGQAAPIDNARASPRPGSTSTFVPEDRHQAVGR